MDTSRLSKEGAGQFPVRSRGNRPAWETAFYSLRKESDHEPSHLRERNYPRLAGSGFQLRSFPAVSAALPTVFLAGQIQELSCQVQCTQFFCQSFYKRSQKPNRE